MHRASTITRRCVLFFAALVLVAGYPTAVMAETLESVTDPALSATTTETQPTPPPVEEQDPLAYTYDAETNKWNSEEWQFNPESGTYEKPPAPIIIEPPVTETTDKPVQEAVDTTVEVDTNVSSTAASGDALITNNTTAGSALTGDADAIATIINAVNSSISADTNQKIATFTQDITGDVKGDIILYPLLLKAMLEAEAQEGAAAVINSTTDFDINNDIILNASSGDATVNGNTTAGDAETGNATAMANVVNILNSLIAAQDSFIGTINIYGSLEGDILIAPDFIPQLLANNGTEGDATTQLSTQDTTTIVNNISAVAESGAASVFGNTSAGSATTGNADSSVVIFNVTGHDIVAENSMLVFVNVLGTWVGMIIDAPVGTTAAMIGSGVTESNQYSPDIVVDAVTKHGITNTIAVNAETGDAVVSNNTSAGNATSGNANALVNVANVSNSSLSLTGWFGVLFINITGDWFGSFQVNTPFGNPITAPVENLPQPSGPVQFVPQQQREQQRPSSARSNGFKVIDSRAVDSVEPTILAVNAQPEVESATAEIKGAATSESASPTSTQADPNDFRMFIALGTIIFTGASIAWVRRAI